MESALPPRYGSHGAYGITPDIDGWINGDVPFGTLNLSPDYALQKSKLHISKMAPTLTMEALNKLFCAHICDDWFGLTEMTRAFGLVSLPFSMIGDILKAPAHLVGAAFTAVQSALGSTRTRKKAESEILTKILESFLMRFESTLMILVRLKLETPETLYRQFQEGQLTPFLTLTLLFTAFASRCAADNFICLASGKSLSKDRCPSIGQTIFKHIHDLKIELILAGVSSKQTLHEAAALIEEWLPSVMRNLKDPESSMDNALPRLHRLLTKLREIQQEISDLPIDGSEISKYEAAPVRISSGVL